jgi:hypothetical protein
MVPGTLHIGAYDQVNTLEDPLDGSQVLANLKMVLIFWGASNWLTDYNI